MIDRPPDKGGVWKPDYIGLYAWRQARLLELEQSPDLLIGAKAYYAAHPGHFIEDWIDTYDPRNAGVAGGLPYVPFILFPRQRLVNQFFDELIANQVSGLIEKARDMGMTWQACAYSVAVWLFKEGMTVGWGSRKEVLVDRRGDPSSIFEKMRMIVRGVPRIFWPAGFDPQNDMNHMRILNPETGNVIMGESGDNMGRGARATIYFIDEAAHLEHAEMIEAALSATTNVKVYISSVNGTGNVYHRKRAAGEEWAPGQTLYKDRVNVFVYDWRDHPMRDQQWYDEKKAQAVAEGMAHIHAQEVDRDYTASTDNIIIPQEWVLGALDAHEKLGITPTGKWTAGMDVADGGIDKNALVIVKSGAIHHCEAWGDRDQGKAARRVIAKLREYHGDIELWYDSIGVGAGVKTETNRLMDINQIPDNLNIEQWRASDGVLNPDKPIIPLDRNSPNNEDHYANLKAQAWFSVRARFYKTWAAVTQGQDFDPEDIISIPSDLPNRYNLCMELSQAVSSVSVLTGKIIVDKAPKDTRSPNMADAAIMALFPARKRLFTLDGVL